MILSLARYLQKLSAISWKNLVGYPKVGNFRVREDYERFDCSYEVDEFR